MKRPPNILVVAKSDTRTLLRGGASLRAHLDYIVETDGEEFTIIKNKVGEVDGPHPASILPVWLASRFT